MPSKVSFCKKTEKTIEDEKKSIRKNYIYKALEEGWTVKKDPNIPKTFEFTRGNLDKPPIDDSKYSNSRRSISAPIVKVKPKKQTLKNSQELSGNNKQ